MKTWRQLEAIAKRQGMTLERDDDGMSSWIGREGILVARVTTTSYSETYKRDRILRAMVEAALEVGR